MEIQKYIEYQINRMMKDTPKERHKYALKSIYAVLLREGFKRKYIGYTIDSILTTRLAKLHKKNN